MHQEPQTKRIFGNWVDVKMKKCEEISKEIEKKFQETL
jgi:hypothetical protein